MLVILSSKYLNLFTLFRLICRFLWSFPYRVLDTLWTKILMLHDFYDGPIRLVSKRHFMLNIGNKQSTVKWSTHCQTCTKNYYKEILSFNC